jgi:hypothetical protein
VIPAAGIRQPPAGSLPPGALSCSRRLLQHTTASSLTDSLSPWLRLLAPPARLARRCIASLGRFTCGCALVEPATPSVWKPTRRMSAARLPSSYGSRSGATAPGSWMTFSNIRKVRLFTRPEQTVDPVVLGRARSFARDLSDAADRRACAFSELNVTRARGAAPAVRPVLGRVRARSMGAAAAAWPSPGLASRLGPAGHRRDDVGRSRSRVCS